MRTKKKNAPRMCLLGISCYPTMVYTMRGRNQEGFIGWKAFFALKNSSR